jgi:hypothetical protein
MVTCTSSGTPDESWGAAAPESRPDDTDMLPIAPAAIPPMPPPIAPPMPPKLIARHIGDNPKSRIEKINRKINLNWVILFSF